MSFSSFPYRGEKRDRSNETSSNGNVVFNFVRLLFIDLKCMLIIYVNNIKNDNK